MGNNLDKKTITEIRQKALRATLIELSEIKEKRERELQEIDSIAKMLIRRDFELSELRDKREEELEEMDRIAKLLVRRDLQLTETIALLEEARARAEEEKDKTLAIITNFADGLLVFDKENNLTLVNPQAEDFFGIKKEEIVGKSILKISRNPVFKNLIELYRKETKRVFRKELKIKEGLVSEMTTIPLMREKEELGTLVILHDVTREKLIEKMKTEFVSLAAHQLRTPLSTIKWILKMLFDEELGKINKEQREFLSDGYKSNERMISLVNDLLNVARIEEGRYIYKLSLADIREITQSIINSHQEEVKKKGLKIELNRPKKKLPRTMFDVEKIRIAIDNIVDNAIRYSLVGGKVTVSLKYGKKEIEFSVKDTGMGIPKFQQERVFTKFFRGVNALRKETEGTGLGLFITKNIIEAHGGKIWFESKEGKGTTFYFTIPIKKIVL